MGRSKALSLCALLRCHCFEAREIQNASSCDGEPRLGKTPKGQIVQGGMVAIFVFSALFLHKGLFFCSSESSWRCQKEPDTVLCQKVPDAVRKFLTCQKVPDMSERSWYSTVSGTFWRAEKQTLSRPYSIHLHLKNWIFPGNISKFHGNISQGKFNFQMYLNECEFTHSSEDSAFH